jgi:DNA repair exonuclease SbcCD ATPase subunit
MSDVNEEKSVDEITKLNNELASKQAVINEFLRGLQEKDVEIRKLIEQRDKRDERIKNLEKLVRNQKRNEEELLRRERLARLLVDQVTQLLYELNEELSGEEYQKTEKIKSLIARMQRLIMPTVQIHLLDFFTQLRAWAKDDEEFKKRLVDMGFGEWETIATDLSKSFHLEP